MKEFKEKVIPVFIPFMGCPHRCVFCNQRRITGYRKEVDIDSVDSHISRSLSTVPAWVDRVEIAFYGGSFSCLPQALQERLLSVAGKYVKMHGLWGIRLSTRPDCLSRSEIEFLKDSGVVTVEIGVQSLDDAVLSRSKRGHTAKDAIDAALRVKDIGLVLGLQIMVGLPGDTGNEFHYTVDLIADEIKPDFVRIYPLLVVKGSELADMYERGEYKPLTLDEAVSLSKYAYRRFQDAGIGVVRMGLQDIPTMRWGVDILGGPYHPSFGELVKSAAFYDQIIEELKGVNPAELSVVINPKDESILRGQHNLNLVRLKRKYPNIRLNVVKDEGIQRGKFVVHYKKVA